MLEETDLSSKSTTNVTTERNAFEDIGSLEELECLTQFLTDPYPGNGKGKSFILSVQYSTQFKKNSV